MDEFNTRNKHIDLTEVKLSSPTSNQMKNSFILKNSGPKIDMYYNMLKKKKTMGVSPERMLEKN